jgi:hypothetical protein
MIAVARIHCKENTVALGQVPRAGRHRRFAAEFGHAFAKHVGFVAKPMFHPPRDPIAAGRVRMRDFRRDAHAAFDWALP